MLQTLIQATSHQSPIIFACQDLQCSSTIISSKVVSNSLHFRLTRRVLLENTSCGWNCALAVMVHLITVGGEWHGTCQSPTAIMQMVIASFSSTVSPATLVVLPAPAYAISMVLHAERDTKHSDGEEPYTHSERGRLEKAMCPKEMG